MVQKNIGKMIDLSKISVKSIQKRKLRSWLTMLGIIIGVAAIIALISLGEGMGRAIEGQLNALGPRMIRVSPGSLQGPPVGLTGLTMDDVRTLESINEFDYVSPVVIESGEVEFKNEKQLLMVQSLPMEHLETYMKDAGLEILSGRNLKSDLEKSAIITEKVAEKKFENRISLRTSITINGEDFKVVGILKNQGGQMDDRIMMAFDSEKELFNKGDSVGLIVGKVKEGEDIEAVAKEVERKLKKSRNDENFEIYTPEQIKGMVNSILGIVNIVLVGIAAISLIVGAVGIMNSMFTSVLERTREIGVMKAIGAKNSDVLSIFLIESGIIGLLGGIVGILLGMGMAFAVEFAAKAAGFPYLDVQLNYGLIIGTALLSFILGMIAGAIPAWRASRLRPVDALRYE